MVQQTTRGSEAFQDRRSCRRGVCPRRLWLDYHDTAVIDRSAVIGRSTDTGLPAGDLANQCRLAGEIITWQGTWNGFDAVPSNIGLDASQLQNYSGPPFGSISPSLGHDIFTIDLATSVDASMITALSNDVATLLADWQAAGCK